MKLTPMMKDKQLRTPADFNHSIETHYYSRKVTLEHQAIVPKHGAIRPFGHQVSAQMDMRHYSLVPQNHFFYSCLDPKSVDWASILKILVLYTLEHHVIDTHVLK